MGFSGVTIDPGVHTAIVGWHFGKMIWIYTISLSGSGDSELLLDLRHKLEGHCNAQYIRETRVIIEDVGLWTGSATSMASGARGNLTTLAKIAGALAFYFMPLNIVEFITPMKWKGNLSNKQLRMVLKQKFNIETKNAHEASAMGLGLYMDGLL